MSFPSLPVLRVGFTPVKGTRHQEQPVSAFDAAGPVGDRRFALVDVATRRVLRTVAHPRLVAVGAVLDGAELEVTLPDGRAVRAVPSPSGERVICDYWGRRVRLELLDGAHDGLFSSWLGRDVRLARAPRGDVVYGAPCTVVTSASLRALGELAGVPDLLSRSARFRATFVVDTDEPYVEESWAGRVVELAGRRVRIGAPIGRCAVVDVDHVTGERGTRLLKTLAEHRPRNAAGEPYFGVYAEPVA